MGRLIAIVLLLLAAPAWSAPAVSSRPVVLYFLSFTCPGCRQITPLMNQLADESAGRWHIEGLAYGTPPQEIAAQAARTGLRFPVSADTQRLARRHEVTVTPTLVLVDAEGNPAERYVGVGGAQRLARALRGGLHETGIYELAREPRRFDGTVVTARAFVVRRNGATSATPLFGLSNGRERLDVETPGDNGKASLAGWLAKEVVVRGTIRVTRGRATLIAASVEPSR